MLTKKVFMGLILTTLDINDSYLRKDNVRGRKRQLSFNLQKMKIPRECLDMMFSEQVQNDNDDDDTGRARSPPWAQRRRRACTPP